MKTNYTVAGVAASTLLLAGATAQAQTAAVTPPPAPHWETSAAAGLTVTAGNTESVIGNLSLDTTKKWEHDEAALGISGSYGKSEGVRNVGFVKTYGQYNHLFDERLYGGLRLEGTHDSIADLSYRVQLSPLAGYYFIKNAKTTLSVEAGPSFVQEKKERAPVDSYVGFRLGEKFEHKLTDTTKVWQSLEYTPQVDRWAKKFLIVAEVGIDTAITKAWSLRLVAQDVRDSEPSVGRKKNDFRLIAGTAYKF